MKKKALSDSEVQATFFDGPAKGEEEWDDNLRDLGLWEERTYKDYPHRTVAGLPREEDVRVVVAGKILDPGCG